MAVSVTGEFTQENNGVNNTEILLDNWIEEINTIFGREYCVRFELVPNNTDIVFPDATTDPWATMPLGSGGCNNSGVIMADQLTVIDSIIGSNNYDVSHVILSTQHLGGGCAGSYTSGISGGFDIPVTRHEMGHQFGQSHTINHSGIDNYEPENGNWTLQGGNGQGRAHAISFHQLALNLLNNPMVGNKIVTGNSIPTINAGENVTIPISTPFILTAEVTDANPEDSLTYVWDNMDRGFPQTIPVANDAQGALFMRLLPTTQSSRTFPHITDVIANNNSNSQEQLPTQARTMNIRITVNDNATMPYNGEEIMASGINSDDISITVDQSGPFVVTSQSTQGIEYDAGTFQELTWEVNGTNVPPVNATHVKISLSTDGGYTFPIVIANNTLNDGTELIEIPELSTLEARIKIEAVGNIFFDLNTENFTIHSTFGMPTSLENSVQVYPNPAKNRIYIKSTRLNYKITLLDLNGKQLIEGDNLKNITLTNLHSGMYFLEFLDLDTQQKLRKKIIHLN